jgi:hypothetical protein
MSFTPHIENEFPAEMEVGARVPIRELPSSKPRNWRVIHACEHARDVLPVVEGQVAAGMRPYIVTPLGAGAAELYLAGKQSEQRRSLSLLRAWQDVRSWRKSLLECDPESSADIVHAHTFAAGMAAVRSLSCVVYDPSACIEELALSLGQCESGSWMGRSFRVAEQFVLSRAEAIVVHSLGMKAAVEERGAPPEGVFLIPEPVNFEEEIQPVNGDYRFAIPIGTTAYFVPKLLDDESENLSAPALAVLEAFALLIAELPESRLLIGAPTARATLLASHLERLRITAHASLVEEASASAAMRDADVVIATDQIPTDIVLARQPNEICLNGLRQGKALLAADVPRNRDASPDGRGCLWFKAGDPRDLSSRMAFLGRNADFRSALSLAGRDFIFATRNSTSVGRKYDEAYRYALHRKKSGGKGPNVPGLQPILLNGF